MRTPSHEANRAMVPMTTTMNALRASARSTPPAPVSGPAPHHPDGDPDPEAQRGAVGGHPDPAPIAAAPPPAAMAAPPSEGEDEDAAPGPSVVQLLQLVEVDVAELGPQALGQHHEDDDAQEDVEGDARAR